MPPANSPINEPRQLAGPTTAPRRRRSPGALSAFLQPASSSSSSSHVPSASAPLPNLTPSGGSEAEDEVEADNISFLRTPFDPADDLSAEALTRELREERRRRTAMQRMHLREERILRDSQRESARRVHEVAEDVRRTNDQSRGSLLRRLNSRLRSQYADGVPSAQSLYDWAPVAAGVASATAASRAAQEEESELDDLLSELRQQQPNTHPDILRNLARHDMDGGGTARYRVYNSRSRMREASVTGAARSTGASSDSGSNSNNNNTSSNSNNNHDHDGIASSDLAPPGHEPSLRSAAILQSVRRNQQYLSMLRHFRERDRHTQETSDPDNVLRERRNMWQQFSVSNAWSTIYERNRIAWQSAQQNQRSDDLHGGSAGQPREHREHLEALRRRYLEDPTHNPSQFEQLIKYMHILRAPDHEFEKLISQLGSGPINRTPDRIRSERKIVQSMAAVCPPHPTSWLTPGTLFSGFQQAVPIAPSSTILHRRAAQRSTIPRRPSNPAGDRPSASSTAISSPSSASSSSWLGLDLTSTPLRFASNSPSVLATATNHSMGVPSERWTVKVTVHTVDYDTMTLQGTMEAYNVPSITTPSASSSASSKITFSTYLEGEIIDFNHHMLVTEAGFNVDTSPEIDASYWRQLEPFSKMTNKQIEAALFDTEWVEKHLMGQYILMRWKERCFVQPTFTSSSALGGILKEGSVSPDTPRSCSPEEASQQQREHLEQFRQPVGNSTTSYLNGADGNRYGLSISGFYYVSMRRKDGRCEGLYFDPHHSPFQHLELNPSEGMWGCGSWSFR